MSKNDFNLKNKNIVVTGGNGFLGKYFCEVISEYGGNAIILDKNNKESKNFILNLKNKYSTNPYFINCDISKEKNVSKSYLKIIEKFTKIDALINNAAINPKIDKTNFNKSLLENYPINQLNDEMAVGITGSLICTKIIGSHLAKNKAGSIINISSDLGVIAPNQSIYNTGNKIKKAKPVSYSIVKSAIIGLTKYTSTYWASKNVRCNAIAPAGIYENQDKKFVKKLSDLIPMNRMANKEDLKGVLILLLSDSSSFLNGQTILIDGGRTVW